jgi:hypothetical protein
LSGNKTDVRHLELAIIIDSEVLRFIITILNHSETHEIIRAQTFLVVKHCHGVGAHYRAAGRAREWLFDPRSSRGVLKWTALLRSYPRRRKKNGNEKVAEGKKAFH